MFVSGFDILPFLLLASVSSNVHSSIVFARHDHFLFPTRYIYIRVFIVDLTIYTDFIYIYFHSIDKSKDRVSDEIKTFSVESKVFVSR